MDLLKKSKLNIGKSKVGKSDEPPPYTTVAPSAPQPTKPALPKQTSTDQKPKPATTDYKPRPMPKNEYPPEERRPRKGKQPAESDSDDSGYEDRKKSKQLVRRDDVKASKRDKGSSKKRRDDDSDDDEEMIVTKTVRKRTLDFHELDEGFVMLLCDAFEVQPVKIATWCENELVKWDNKTKEYDIKKILDREGDKETRFFTKQYAKYKADWQMPAEQAGPSRGPMVVVDERPILVSTSRRSRRRGGYHPDCPDCAYTGHFCGDPHHGFEDDWWG